MGSELDQKFKLAIEMSALDGARALEVCGGDPTKAVSWLYKSYLARGIMDKEVAIAAVAGLSVHMAMSQEFQKKVGTDATE